MDSLPSPQLLPVSPQYLFSSSSVTTLKLIAIVENTRIQQWETAQPREFEIPMVMSWKNWPNQKL
jgi:hypothetical protein